MSDETGTGRPNPIGRVVHYYRRAMVPAGSEDEGLTAAVWRWAADLAGAGVPVAVAFDPAARAGEPRSSAVELVPVRHVGTWRLRLPVDIERNLRRGDLLVLHWGHVAQNVVAGNAARRAQVPYLMTPHGAYERQARARRAWLKAGFYLGFEHRLLVGSIGAHVFFKAEADDVHDLAPGLPVVVAPTSAAERVGPGWNGGGGYVSWIGRYDIEHKGLDLLFKAIAHLPPDRRPRVRLHGVDSVDSRADVAALARHLGIGDQVEVGGDIRGADKDSFLSSAAVYVQPSRWESHSVALVENLALGVPAVVSSRMPIAPLLDEAGAAVVVSPQPATLAAGIEKALGLGELLSVAARRFVADRLGADRVIGSWLEQVGALLLDPAPRAAGRPRPGAYWRPSAAR